MPLLSLWVENNFDYLFKGLFHWTLLKLLITYHLLSTSYIIDVHCSVQTQPDKTQNRKSVSYIQLPTVWTWLYFSSLQNKQYDNSWNTTVWWTLSPLLQKKFLLLWIQLQPTNFCHLLTGYLLRCRLSPLCHQLTLSLGWQCFFLSHSCHYSDRCPHPRQ